MAAITAKMVSELREKTGAGMMDCKRALVAADGDVELAIENLRQSGVAKAEKKSGRATEQAKPGPVFPAKKLLSLKCCAKPTSLPKLRNSVLWLKLCLTVR